MMDVNNPNMQQYARKVIPTINSHYFYLLFISFIIFKIYLKNKI